MGAAAAASGQDGMTPLQATALRQLPKLTRLRTLVLKDFGGPEVGERAFLKEVGLFL